jgi:ubiquinone/menaquinone biosynthesis C-methylase UbiE
VKATECGKRGTNTAARQQSIDLSDQHVSVQQRGASIHKEGYMSYYEGWQLAGSAPDIYEHYLVPAVVAPWAVVVNDLGAPQPGERVLDVATGTGIVARVAAERLGTGGRVIGLDVNPAMLAVARSAPSPAGVSVEWRAGSVDALPFPEDSFDIVFCQLGLQYFSDRPRALREMHRVLAPNGRFVLMVWGPLECSPGYVHFADALERHVSTEAAAIIRTPFALGDVETLHALISTAAFRDVEIRSAEGTVRFPSAEDMVRIIVAGSPLAGPVGQADDHAHAALISDVGAALQSYTNPDGLAFPIAANLVSARK